jgi:hypothetical protein
MTAELRIDPLQRTGQDVDCIKSTDFIYVLISGGQDTLSGEFPEFQEVAEYDQCSNWKSCNPITKDGKNGRKVVYRSARYERPNPCQRKYFRSQ